MRIQSVFTVILGLIGSSLFAQTTYEAAVPDSIKKKCDAVIISEIGNTAFTNNVKYIKSDVFRTSGNTKYTIFYSFSFPNVKESHVVFSLDYKSGKGVIRDAAFKNYTRLPNSVKLNGTKIISYGDAKKTTIESDSLFRTNQQSLYGELSTEYDEKKKDYYFVWYFYYIAQCKTCKDKPYSLKSMYIDAVSGKTINRSN
ncbi:MAG TPA: hypothetical protein VN026_05480 [Bacteroidia bacterium]|jgi:hypothetical protein|nr:hypothetical protein [Bacteroidia bacterium]